MSETFFLLWFAALFGMAFAWLALIVWTFRRLRTRHVTMYEAIGSPSLFWNNSIRNNWLFLRFLYLGKWRELNDRQLAGVVRLMQVMLVIYIIGFIGLSVAIIIDGLNPSIGW